jgi:hypothetical protein
MMAAREAACNQTMNLDVRAPTLRRAPTFRRAGFAAAWLLVLMAAGCSGTTGPSGGGPRSPGSGSPSGPASPSLELASPKPAGSPLQAYVGVLGSDSIEGGCVYLQAPDGRKYEVIYPDGWQVQKSPLALIAPDGRVVAEAGDEVEIKGSEAGEMVSICQIGPIVRAVEVVIR